MKEKFTKLYKGIQFAQKPFVHQIEVTTFGSANKEYVEGTTSSPIQYIYGPPYTEVKVIYPQQKEKPKPEKMKRTIIME
jgi:hypothetical protein